MSGALGDDSCAPGLPSHGEHYFWVYPPQLPEPKRLSLTDTRRARRPRSCIRLHYLYDSSCPYSCATRTLSWRPFFARREHPSLLTPLSRVCFFVYAHWKYHLACRVWCTIRAIPISSYGLKVVVRYLILLF